MTNGIEQKESFLLTDPVSANTSLLERSFYIDCDPTQAISRSARVQNVAKILNTLNAFGSARTQDVIREAFQAEVEFSRSPAEALSRINKCMALINLELRDGLRLGPRTFAACDRIYLSSNNAPTQTLDLNLRLSKYGKKSIHRIKAFTAVA